MFDKSERVHFLEKKWTRSQIDTFGRKINTPHFYSNLHFESKNWNHLTKNTPKINISMGNDFHAIQGKVPIFNISMGSILFRINLRVKPGVVLLCSFVAQSDWRHFFQIGGRKNAEPEKNLGFFVQIGGGNKKYSTEKLSATKKYPTFFISMWFQVTVKLSTTKKKHFSMEIWHTWSIEDNFDQFFINISILVPTQVIARLNQGWKWTQHYEKIRKTRGSIAVKMSSFSSNARFSARQLDKPKFQISKKTQILANFCSLMPVKTPFYPTFTIFKFSDKINPKKIPPFWPKTIFLDKPALEVSKYDQ